MKLSRAAVLILALLAPLPAAAEGMRIIGYGRLFSNDFLGDGEDRWQTGSYVISQLRSSSGREGLPRRLGELLEYRLRFGIIAPSNIVSPDPDDRRYAGIVSFGVHSHFNRAGVETSVGMDLVAVGPQTGMARFQARMHELLGEPNGDYGNQITDRVYPTALIEVARQYDLGSKARLRPFVELQAGAETLLRTGADLTFCKCGGGIFLRDVTTGQRYAGTRCRDESSIAFTVGADTAKVFDSAFLPSSDGYRLTPARNRIRVGIRKRVGAGTIFYGATWLGREFAGQGEPQIVGSINLDLAF